MLSPRESFQILRDMLAFSCLNVHRNNAFIEQQCCHCPNTLFTTLMLKQSKNATKANTKQFLLTLLVRSFFNMSFPPWKNNILIDEKLLLLCFSVLSDSEDDVARNRTDDEGRGFQSWKPPQRKIQICRSEPLTAPSSKHADRSTCC